MLDEDYGVDDFGEDELLTMIIHDCGVYMYMYKLMMNTRI